MNTGTVPEGVTHEVELFLIITQEHKIVKMQENVIWWLFNMVFFPKVPALVTK